MKYSRVRGEDGKLSRDRSEVCAVADTRLLARSPMRAGAQTGWMGPPTMVKPPTHGIGTVESTVNQSLTASSRNTRDKASDGIPSLDAASFETRVLQGQGPIAVEFMSYSCAHCAAMEPVLQQVAETLRSRERIFRVNVAVELDVAGRYEIDGTPTLIMFLNGHEVGRAEGPDPDVETMLAVVSEPFGIQ